MTTVKFAGLDTDPKYAEISKHLADRRTERSAIRIERDQIAERIRAQIDSAASNNLDIAAAERLEAIATGKPYQSKETYVQRLAELNLKLAGLDQAIELLMHRQRSAANVHSIAVCTSLKKHHDALATEIFDSILAAHTSAANYKAFLDTLEDAGILTHHFPQGVMPSFIEAGDKYGRLAHFLNEMANAGLMSRSKIPAKLDFKR